MKVILIDGSGFMWRAYHAVEDLVRSDGTPIGCVHGFSSMIWKLLTDDWRSPDPATHIGIFFDKGSITWRNAIYVDYKLNRRRDEKVSLEIDHQIPLVKRASRAFGLSVIEMEGYEADDLIATYMSLAIGEDCDEVIIVSQDKDFMQFMGAATLYCPMKKRVLTEEDVIRKLGVTPDKATDAQALIGDTSDNVPGIPGVGEKTAGALLEEFGDLEGVLANADDIPSRIRNWRKISAALIGNADQVRLAKRLVTMKCDVPVEQPLSTLAVEPVDRTALYDFLEEMEFKSLAAQVESYFGRGFAPLQMAS